MAHKSYFSEPRTDVLTFVSALGARFPKHLDLGCGFGLFGASLKHLRIVDDTTGIDYNTSACQEAGRRLDTVYNHSLESMNATYFPSGVYDLITALDVLEHIDNIGDLMRAIRNRLKNDGTLVVSIPNIRHWSVVVPLVFKGEFKYTDSGILDRTHVRFYTHKSILELLHSHGFSVVKETTNGGSRWPYRLLNILSLGLLREFFVRQFIIALRKT